MTQEKRITVITDEKLHKAAKVKAAKSGMSVSDVVRSFLLAWIAGKIDLPEATEQREAQDKK